MKKDNVTNQTNHIHNYNLETNLNWLFKCLILLLLVVHFLNSINHTTQKDEIVYNQCTDACSEKHFMGLQTGIDGNQMSSYVREFDRTRCIESCNSMYKVIRR